MRPMRVTSYQILMMYRLINPLSQKDEIRGQTNSMTLMTMNLNFQKTNPYRLYSRIVLSTTMD